MTVSFEDAVAPWVTAAHVGLIAVSIVAAIIALVYALSSHRSASEKCSIYIDRNGSASEESQQSYSTTFKRISIALAILSIAGLGLSIAYGVSDSFGPHKKHRSAASGILASWTPVAIWVSCHPFLESNRANPPNALSLAEKDRMLINPIVLYLSQLDLRHRHQASSRPLQHWAAECMLCLFGSG